MQRKIGKKGFTLIELLVVIAIIGILTAVIVLVINPVEMMKKSRDSQRISDMGTIQTAINLALTDGKSFTAFTENETYATAATTTVYATTATPATTGTAVQSNTGTGWVPLDFSTVSSGAPISALPLDPQNSVTSFYRFIHDGAGHYKIDCAFESTEYTTTQDKDGKDGGNNANRYEVGNDLAVATG